MNPAELKSVVLPEKVRRFIADATPRYPTVRAVLIPAMMECQKYFGQVTPGIARALADEMEVPYSEVQAVRSFYTMFHEKSTGEYLVGICGTWNCEHAGAKELAKHFCKRYDCQPGEVVGNGLMSMELIECLCDCHNAPSIQIMHHGEEFSAHWANNLTLELFDTILDELASGQPDALRERLVRIDEKANPPDNGKWIWLVTTNNQYPVKVEQKDGEMFLNDGYGRLAGLKESNPKLFGEIKEALKQG